MPLGHSGERLEGHAQRRREAAAGRGRDLERGALVVEGREAVTQALEPGAGGRRRGVGARAVVAHGDDQLLPFAVRRDHDLVASTRGAAPWRTAFSTSVRSENEGTAHPRPRAGSAARRAGDRRSAGARGRGSARRTRALRRARRGRGPRRSSSAARAAISSVARTARSGWRGINCTTVCRALNRKCGWSWRAQRRELRAGGERFGAGGALGRAGRVRDPGDHHVEPDAEHQEGR